MAQTSYALPSPGQLYGQAQQYLQGFGTAQQQQLQQSYQAALGMASQQLASSGLAGTSVGSSVQSGYMRQYQMALNALGQQISQQQLGAQQTFGLGGIATAQAGQQIGQQGALGMGNLGVNQGYLALAQQSGQQQAALGGDASQGYNWQPSAGFYGQLAEGAQNSLFG
jgi:hypothetical protein